MIIIVVVLAIVLLAAWYFMQHSGQTTTVHNPNVPTVNVQHYANDAFTAALQWLTTPTGGTLVAATIITVAAVSLYKKMSKGQAILLSCIGLFIVLALAGVITKGTIR